MKKGIMAELTCRRGTGETVAHFYFIKQITGNKSHFQAANSYIIIADLVWGGRYAVRPAAPATPDIYK